MICKTIKNQGPPTSSKISMRQVTGDHKCFTLNIFGTAKKLINHVFYSFGLCELWLAGWLTTQDKKGVSGALTPCLTLPFTGRFVASPQTHGPSFIIGLGWAIAGYGRWADEKSAGLELLRCPGLWLKTMRGTQRGGVWSWSIQTSSSRRIIFSVSCPDILLKSMCETTDPGFQGALEPLLIEFEDTWWTMNRRRCNILMKWAMKPRAVPWR